MNLEFWRESFRVSDVWRYWGWLLGIIVFLLLVLEPESWYSAATAPAAEAVPVPAPATTAMATPVAVAVPAAMAVNQPRPHYLPPRPVQTLPPPSSPLDRQQHHENRLAELLKKVAN